MGKIASLASRLRSRVRLQCETGVWDGSVRPECGPHADVSRSSAWSVSHNADPEIALRLGVLYSQIMSSCRLHLIGTRVILPSALFYHIPSEPQPGPRRVRRPGSYFPACGRVFSGVGQIHSFARLHPAPRLARAGTPGSSRPLPASSLTPDLLEPHITNLKPSARSLPATAHSQELLRTRIRGWYPSLPMWLTKDRLSLPLVEKELKI